MAGCFRHKLRVPSIPVFYERVVNILCRKVKIYAGAAHNVGYSGRNRKRREARGFRACHDGRGQAIGPALLRTQGYNHRQMLQ